MIGLDRLSAFFFFGFINQELVHTAPNFIIFLENGLVLLLFFWDVEVIVHHAACAPDRPRMGGVGARVAILLVPPAVEHKVVGRDLARGPVGLHRQHHILQGLRAAALSRARAVTLRSTAAAALGAEVVVPRPAAELDKKQTSRPEMNGRQD